MMNSQDSDMTMRAISHEAMMAAHAVSNAANSVAEAIQSVACLYEKPSVIYRPSIKRDGNQWCALYGANLQDGVAGFGDSPSGAMADFDANWIKALT